jgi:hypothetical protein
VQSLAPATMGWIASAMIVGACGFLVPEIRAAGVRRAARERSDAGSLGNGKPPLQ